MPNVALEKFRELIAEQGWTTRTIDQPDAQTECLAIYTPRIVLAIIRRFADDDGYSLYMLVDGNSINADIEAIRNAGRSVAP